MKSFWLIAWAALALCAFFIALWNNSKEQKDKRPRPMQEKVMVMCDACNGYGVGCEVCRGRGVFMVDAPPPGAPYV